MFAQSSTASSSMTNGGSSNGGTTSVYPPQPYGPGQQSISVSQPGPSMLTQGQQSQQPSSPIKAQGPSMTSLNNSSGQIAASAAIANGASPRKRNASNSPGPSSNETKEKKIRSEGSRDESGHQSNSPSGSKPANAFGTTATSKTDGEAVWGEEASKLDVYVWDYLTRRGFNRTAKSLMNEAGMSKAPDVPLKTPQGLLFEYWAIFWDVFAARSGRGSAEATAYYEMQEARQAQRINDLARRSEVLEKAGHPADANQGRFPPVLMSTQKEPGQTGGNASQLANQAQQKTTAPNGQQNATEQQLQQQANPSAQPQGPTQQQQQQQQAQPQQSVRPVQPGATAQESSANWNGTPNALQQQTQMLLLAAQRQNIPIDELKNMNPAMRTALIQSVAAAGPQAAAAAQAIRPGGQPFDQQAMQQRMQQQQQQQQQQAAHQQALQRQLQQQRAASQAGMRPGMMAPQSVAGTPGTPTGMAIQGAGAAGGGVQAVPQGMNGPLQQGQAGQGMNQAGRPVPGVMGVGGVGDGQAHPRLTPEQQQVLITQHQSLQHQLRQELFHAQNAPTPAIAERSFQNAQQIQMRLAQLSNFLKAQPALQQQASLYAQQQQQQQQQNASQVQQQAGGMARPGMPPGMQGLPAGFPAGLTPQQQQQILAARRAAQQPNRPPADQNGMMSSPLVGGGAVARPPMGVQGQQPQTPFGTNGMPFDPTGGVAQQHGTPQQQHGTPQQQHGTPQQQGSTPGPDHQQQRTPFAFANPFAAGAGAQRSAAGAQGEEGGHPTSAGIAGSFQQPQAPQYAGARPGVPLTRMPSGMGPPVGPQHMSSPSPRVQQSNLLGGAGGGDGSVSGSPANIPSTPKTANAQTPQQQQGGDASKKKKEPARSRKNSKPSTSVPTTKTPVLGAAVTPAAQAATPASSSIPTPGKDGSSTMIGANKVDPPAASSAAMPGHSFDPSAPSNANPSAPASTTASNPAQTASQANANSGLPSAGGATSASDDFSQMFGSGDMSQFLNDFDFPTTSFGSTDGGGLGSFGDSWDGTGMGNLFGDSSS